MGKLAYLLGERDGPTFSVDLGQLDLGAETTHKVASAIAAETGKALEPIADIFEGYSKELTASTVSEVANALKALEGLKGQVDESIKPELAKIEAAIKATNNAVKASSNNAERIRDSLVSAMSRIQIPDYTGSLENIELRQLMLADTVKDALKTMDKEPTPKEWDFTVIRNRNGFIQSVTAKAK